MEVLSSFVFGFCKAFRSFGSFRKFLVVSGSFWKLSEAF